MSLIKDMKDLDGAIKDFIRRDLPLDHEPLNLTQATIIRFIRSMDGCVSQNELVSFLKLKKSSVTGALVALESKDMISRSTDSADKRNKLVSLSLKAVNQMEMIDRKMELLHQRLLKGVSEEECAFLKDLLMRMKKNMEVEDSETDI